MTKNIIFSKEEILKQFSTEELILELVTRDGKYLGNFFEAFIGSSIITRTQVKITADLKNEHIEKVKEILETLKKNE
ncbi:MAG: hypothetical protein SOR11_07490 [Fusobacterium sp.]|uniref:hypothetical protein n=1 Tax=Fusobacterium sp. TaxID=68766 RepID=UPI002A75EE34|nr:hypothetical protein [Fusobacterium sp.]MDY3059825.1 hypothetical protein [Fusobacterium sp.]